MFHNNRGFSLIFAIFMLVIFGFIGTAVLTMLTTSTVTSSEDLLSAQALFLAESGAEIRIKKALNDDVAESEKNFIFKNNNNLKIYVKLHKITDLQSGKELYKVISKGEDLNVKREIQVKFWK